MYGLRVKSSYSEASNTRRAIKPILELKKITSNNYDIKHRNKTAAKMALWVQRLFVSSRQLDLGLWLE